MDQITAPVYDPVDTNAYPERSYSEASKGVHQVIPHDPESRAEVFWEQRVNEAGEISLHPKVANPPHGDYVEHPDATPGYRPPVYDEDGKVLLGGEVVKSADYSTWKVSELTAEVDRRDLDREGLTKKSELVSLLKENDEG